MNAQEPNQTSQHCLEKTIDIVIPVKNGGEKLIEHVRLWLEQEIPEDWEISLFLVDDGSTDGIPEKIGNMFPNSVTVIRNSQSKGRAAARNIGASYGKGSFIAFFDALGFPATKKALASHIERLESGKKCLFGGVSAEGNDFGAKYFRRICDRRKLKFIMGEKHTLTTANFMVSRLLFCQVGKFDERYQSYGFEDRDLFIKIADRYPEICYVPEAIINRDVSDFTLNGICEKMYSAGRYTSSIFYETHPDVYKSMIYSKVDVRCCGAFKRWVFNLMISFCPLSLIVGQIVLKNPVPFWVKAAIVQICSGLFFMSGTKDDWLASKSFLG
ncbi:MAG: glycosyltransferase [Betaproteobacteria bacterium]|nr:glycosyltransferase [Betaproteobacteria bacterium]